MTSKSVFLDVDSSICERNYLITQPTDNDELEKLLNPSGLGQLPPKQVKPSPGFCVKSREIGTNKKIFINICSTDAIPAPKDLSEFELVEILDKDEISDFRVPMSIGDMREDVDKKGENASVCDIAINTDFYNKVERIDTFKHFLIAVAFEGFKEKYKMNANDERIVLRNKKAVGQLQVHRIQQRDIDKKLGAKLPTFDEILHKNDQVKPKIMEISSNVQYPANYRLYRKKDCQDVMYAEAHLPYLISSKDLSLHVGEDRIYFETESPKYVLDIFHPFRVDQGLCSSHFNTNTKILTVKMPIII